MSSRSKQTKAKMLGGLGILSLALGLCPQSHRTGDHENVDDLVRLGLGRMGLPDAPRVLLVVDLRGYRKWTLACVVIGTNPIFIYMATSILPIRQRVEIFTRVIAGHMGAAGPPFNSLAVLALEWLLLFWMYRRKIFIKA